MAEQIRLTLARRMQGFGEATGSPAVSVAVVSGDHTICVDYGLASVELRAAATAETMYKVGSLSKQFLALASVRLSRDCGVDLDRPLHGWIEEIPASWDGVTLRRLLNHTSGLPRDLPSFDPYADVSLENYLAAGVAVFPTTKPGTRWSYSNLGYFVAAALLERLGGMRLYPFIETAILRPLGMGRTTAARWYDVVPGRADSYQAIGGKIYKMGDLIALRPSGAFLSTSSELASWAANLLGFGANGTEDLGALVDGAEETGSEGVRYGLGVFVVDHAGVNMVRHGGALWGFRAELMVFPALRTGVVALSNLRDSDVANLSLEIAVEQVPSLQPALPGLRQRLHPGFG